jgi:hypothetical protein
MFVGLYCIVASTVPFRLRMMPVSNLVLIERQGLNVFFENIAKEKI